MAKSSELIVYSPLETSESERVLSSLMDVRISRLIGSFTDAIETQSIPGWYYLPTISSINVLEGLSTPAEGTFRYSFLYRSLHWKTTDVSPDQWPNYLPEHSSYWIRNHEQNVRNHALTFALAYIPIKEKKLITYHRGRRHLDPLFGQDLVLTATPGSFNRGTDSSLDFPQYLGPRAVTPDKLKRRIAKLDPDDIEGFNREASAARPPAFASFLNELEISRLASYLETLLCHPELTQYSYRTLIQRVDLSMFNAV